MQYLLLTTAMNHMKISIITPTHNTKYLEELKESIESQTYSNWEWIILFNGDARPSFSPTEKIKFYRFPYNFTTTPVGFLKKYASLQAIGDIILEVDHDDLLTPDALERVSEAFEADKEIGFVFSDNAKLADNFTPYDKAFGWESSNFLWKGQELKRMHSFEPNARSFSFIWYAPDHLRAWRKDVYLKIGGHNENLDVLDDQDLMIRTFLNTKVHFIKRVLYLYRITGENTWIKRNQSIQTRTVEIYNQYAYELAARQADLNGTLKLDLGGGFNKPEGFKSVDLKNGDITADLNERWPFEDNSVGVIRAHDIFEHLKDKEHVMSEAFRVLEDGGMLMIQVPSTDGRGAFQDPTHISYWNENTIWYWTRRELAKYIYNDKVRFQEFRLETIYPNDYCRENKIPYVVAYLSAIKSDKRRPHTIKI